MLIPHLVSIDGHRLFKKQRKERYTLKYLFKALAFLKVFKIELAVKRKIVSTKTLRNFKTQAISPLYISNGGVGGRSRADSYPHSSIYLQGKVRAGNSLIVI